MSYIYQFHRNRISFVLLWACLLLSESDCIYKKSTSAFLFLLSFCDEFFCGGWVNTGQQLSIHKASYSLLPPLPLPSRTGERIERLKRKLWGPDKKFDRLRKGNEQTNKTKNTYKQCKSNHSPPRSWRLMPSQSPNNNHLES